jgi:hypothetical protein
VAGLLKPDPDPACVALRLGPRQHDREVPETALVREKSKGGATISPQKSHTMAAPECFPTSIGTASN